MVLFKRNFHVKSSQSLIAFFQLNFLFFAFVECQLNLTSIHFAIRTNNNDQNSVSIKCEKQFHRRKCVKINASGQNKNQICIIANRSYQSDKQRKKKENKYFLL